MSVFNFSTELLTRSRVEEPGSREVEGRKGAASAVIEYEVVSLPGQFFFNDSDDLMSRLSRYESQVLEHNKSMADILKKYGVPTAHCACR